MTGDGAARMSNRIRSPKGTIGVLDIGTSKVSCLIASVDGDTALAESPGQPGLRVIGAGLQRSRGVKAGVVVDLAAAGEAVRAAIAQAEAAAGMTLTHVLCAITCGRLKSLRFMAHADTVAGTVGRGDLERMSQGARAYAEHNGRMLVQMNRLGWRLDGAPYHQDPVGMPAQRMSAVMHAVTADQPPLRNLFMLLEHCYVSAAGLVAAPTASALAVSNDEERRLGVTVIDFGAGTTTLAQYAEGRLVRVEAVPAGGGLVTYDIARTLHTPLEEAERIKALYGTLVTAPSDEHEHFSHSVAGGGGGDMPTTTKAHLAGIIRSRMGAVLDLVGERAGSALGGRAASTRVVITGGASEMTGMADFVSSRFGVSVREGRPQPMPGLPPHALSPQFAVVSGLLNAAAASSESVVALTTGPGAQAGYLERVGKWLKDGF